MNVTQILTILLGILFFTIIVLGFVYWFLSIKEKDKNVQGDNKSKEKDDEKKNKSKKSGEYTKVSIFEFMEFDEIEDNMIVQEDGKRYLMAIECEGINYDLMSEIEKTSVEAGFVQFLNTLRHPIQIYTQTRTINIGSSIEKYRERIKEIKKELEQKKVQLNKLIQYDNTSSKQIEKLKMDILRNQNLFDYGQDVISNIEKMSLNKNVLKKHYYIIVPYYASELEGAELGEEEKKNMIFSELYTRCQALIRTLFACNIKSRVLNSNELVELLYVAYNRDESEVYTVEKALKAGYTELYSTGKDVLDKKIEALNEEIEKRALELAQDTVQEVKSEKARLIEKKEKSFDELVKEMAERIINENKNYIEKNVMDESIKRIRNTNKKQTKDKGGVENEAKKERARKAK